jgi:hypothetical protein
MREEILSTIHNANQAVSKGRSPTSRISGLPEAVGNLPSRVRKNLEEGPEGSAS